MAVQFLRWPSVPSTAPHSLHLLSLTHCFLVAKSLDCVHCPPTMEDVSDARHVLFHMGTDLTAQVLPCSGRPMIHGQSFQSGGTQQLTS